MNPREKLLDNLRVEADLERPNRSDYLRVPREKLRDLYGRPVAKLVALGGKCVEKQRQLYS